MPPYWDNKSLPTPTRYFIFNFLIISFIFIGNKCLSDAIWDLKREKKSLAKGGFELGSIALKSMCLIIYATDTEWASLCSLDSPNHTLVGGVSVNSLCQQGGLSALSVNRLCYLLVWYWCGNRLCELRLSLSLSLTLTHSLSLSVCWSGGGLRSQEADGGVGGGAVVGSDPGLRHRLMLNRLRSGQRCRGTLNHQLGRTFCLDGFGPD